MNFADTLVPTSALFLDFDGTLVDIASNPDAVIVPPGLLDTLVSVHKLLGGAVALISGRPISQIDHYLHPLVMPAAGVHGAERRSASGEVTLMSTYPLDSVETTARSLVAQHPRLRVEVKRGSIALHYRQAPELEALCHDAMRAAVDESPGMVLMRGKMVLEAKPGGATKGIAIEAFMQEAPFAGRAPVFVGDDVTDEMGFAMVQRLQGLGVKIGEGPTCAWQRLASPAEFRDQLKRAVAPRAGKVNA